MFSQIIISMIQKNYLHSPYFLLHLNFTYIIY